MELRGERLVPAPVGARFKGHPKMLDVKAPTSYTIQFDGQVGSRLIDAAAGKIAEDFFTVFEAALQPAGAGQAPAPAAAGAKGNNALWSAGAAAVAIAVAWWVLKR